MTEADTPYQRIVAYHQATKHHPDRYARSPGYMDWANQPDPFRSWHGCETVDLPFLAEDPPAGHAAMYHRRGIVPAPLTVAAVAGFLELSLGLSAWKAAGESRWSLRMNPSSGNLHPTEGHLVLPDMTGLTAGLYHYRPLEHRLERRADTPAPLGDELAAHLGTRGFAVALTSIFWRESWKYGERAYRYCQHDVGHALAALGFSAALLGWRLTVLGNLSDGDLARMLGLDRTDWPRLEEEHPDLAVWVHPADTSLRLRGLPEDLVKAFADQAWTGRPGRLSRAPVDWQVISEAAEATQKPRTAEAAARLAERPAVVEPASPLTAATVIRKRRSATAFDPEAVMEKAVLEAILDKTLARNETAPFDAGIGAPAVDLVLFIHRVRNLAPGLYALDRGAGDSAALKAALKPGFAWEPASASVPLYRLESGDFRAAAISLSCHQPIAGFSVFSLAMVARFADCLEKAPHRYRHLFWEAGMIGQILYLEAEAHGFRGTGIGCYFDDAVHDLLGIEGTDRQSLYHFTVGLPREDPRLSTLPAYHHLKGR